MTSNTYNEYSALYKKRAFKEAADFAERCSLAPGENSVFWLTQQSRALTGAGQARKAYDCANRAVQSAPGNQYALLARAEALLKHAEYDRALNDFSELLQSGKSASRVRLGILECIARSTKDWGRVLALAGEWDLPPREKFRWRVDALIGLKRDEDAIKACRQWLEQYPDNPAALWKLAELEIRRDGLEQVLSRMGRMAKIPGRPPVYVEIYASLCRRAGNTDAALGQYDKLAVKTGDPRIVRKQAFALAKSGHEDEAIPLLEELLRLDPKDMYVNKSYIAACRRAGVLERAQAFYRELLSAHPEEKTIYGRLRSVQKEAPGS